MQKKLKRCGTSGAAVANPLVEKKRKTDIHIASPSSDQFGESEETHDLVAESVWPQSHLDLLDDILDHQSPVDHETVQETSSAQPNVKV